MMLGIEGYGSDTDNESDNEGRQMTAPTSAKTSPFSSTPSTITAPETPLPPRPKRAPKKITIGLPSLPANDDDLDDLKDERPATKKPRLGLGAGASSLLSMLPAPKQMNPTPLPPSERILGDGKGPGLTFRTPYPAAGARDYPTKGDSDNDVPVLDSEPTSIPFLPPSLGKRRPNVSVEEGKFISQNQTQKPTAPPVDFFSLGTSTASSSKVTAPTLSGVSSLPVPSSAPIIPTFEPPEPLQTDPYPGYYQLPTGVWAAHDPVFFAKYIKKWEKEYNEHVRALEKGMVKGFEGLEKATVEEVDAMKEMEKAKVEIKEREERKAITQGAGGGPVAPKMNINASKLSGIARSRHQLSTLLKEAYENREALEEKIAQGRRNRKEAGNKYGF